MFQGNIPYGASKLSVKHLYKHIQIMVILNLQFSDLFRIGTGYSHGVIYDL